MIILNDILEKLEVEVAMDDNLGILFPVIGIIGLKWDIDSADAWHNLIFHRTPYNQRL